MMLGNVHDETAVASRGEMTWETAPAALDTAVHEYLGPYTAAEVVAKFREIHPGYSPIQVAILQRRRRFVRGRGKGGRRSAGRRIR